ncbi:MAG: hypothetical protein CMJ31_04605 [Phycisphaerae bacterium]|nr:hypothetical protein [Phycisphaerae bacterium]
MSIDVVGVVIRRRPASLLRGRERVCPCNRSLLKGRSAMPVWLIGPLVFLGIVAYLWLVLWSHNGDGWLRGMLRWLAANINHLWPW